MPIQEATLARARNTDPQTSHDAAEKVKRMEEQRLAILVLLKATPLTDENIADLYELVWESQGFPPPTPSGLRSRRNELVRDGRVEATGDKKPTRSGCKSIVWQVKK